MKPPDSRREPAPETPAPKDAHLNLNRQHRTRSAEDCVDHLLEIDRWLDAADVVILDALSGGGFTLELAAENALVAHGKIRRHLGAAVVGAVA